MYSIYVDGKQIDTFGTDNIVLNALVFDVAKPESRGVTATNKVILPKTANNVEIFKIFDGDLFSKTFNADIYEKTLHILEGSVTVIELTEYIVVQIVEIFKQIMADLKKPMYLLDISSEDFIYNLTNYNIVKNLTSGFVSWELVDNRISSLAGLLLDTTLDPNIGIFRPHFNVLNIVEKIFEDSGFTVDSSNLDSSIADLRMLSNADDFWIAFYQLTYTSGTFLANVLIDLPDIVADPVNVDYQFGAAPYIDFDLINQIDLQHIYTRSDPNDYVNNTKYIIEIDIDEKATFVVLKQDFLSGDEWVEIEQIVNKTAIIFVDEINHTEAVYLLSMYFTSNVTVNKFRIIGLAKESEIYLSGQSHFWYDNTQLSGWKRVHAVNPDVALLDGMYFKARYNLPDWDQSDFLREFWKLFNVKVAIQGTEVILTHYVKNGVVDITPYITAPRKTINNNIYAQNNYFRYDNDLSMFNKEYGAKTNEKTIIKSGFDGNANSENIELSAPYTIGLAPKYNTISPNDNASDIASLKDRLFISEAHDLPLEINADKKLVFTGLRFNELYDSYYSDVWDYLQDSLKITYPVKIDYITFLRIIDLGFIYDKILGRELTVLTVGKYNANRTTTIVAITREI